MEDTVGFAKVIFRGPDIRRDIGVWSVDFLLGEMAANTTGWAPFGAGSLGLNISAMSPKPYTRLTSPKTVWLAVRLLFCGILHSIVTHL